MLRQAAEEVSPHPGQLLRGNQGVLAPYRRLDDPFEPVEERSVTRAPIAGEIGATARAMLEGLEVPED